MVSHLFEKEICLSLCPRLLVCVSQFRAMSEENIRRRVVNSFRKAIDFEQQNNDVVSIYMLRTLESKFKLPF